MTHHSPRGAVLLLNVLVLGVVSVAAATVLARGSFEGFLQSNDMLFAWNTRADVLGCIDEAIIQIQKENDFVEPTIFTGTATCDVTITTPTSGERTVTATLTEHNITRSVTAHITLSPFAVTHIQEP